MVTASTYSSMTGEWLWKINKWLKLFVLFLVIIYLAKSNVYMFSQGPYCESSAFDFIKYVHLESEAITPFYPVQGLVIGSVSC